MSFWQNYAQQAQQNQNAGSVEVGGGDLTPIPAGSKLIAIVEEAKFDTAKVFGTEIEHDILSLKWKVIDGPYKNRVIFQKVHCLPGSNPEKTDNGMQMLLAVDHNAGGKITAKASSGQEPTEMDFATQLTNKPMIIRVDVWETEDKSKSGNWINGVFSRGSTNPTTEAEAASAKQQAPAQKQQTPQQQQQTPNDTGFDEDIGF